nr:hypothetical protein [Tanacetum cinerariifolium]
MTAYPEISRRVHDRYHNLEQDEMVESIFNSGKNKAGVGIKIPSWITDEMKLMENYRIRELFEARQNVEKVNEHLVAEDIEKMVEGTENVDTDKLVDESENTQIHNQEVPGTRLDPESYKESPKVEIIADVLVNVIEKEEDSTENDYEIYMSNHILHVHPTQASQVSTQEQQYQLYLTMKNDLQLQRDDLPIWLVVKIKFEGLTAFNTSCRPYAIHLRNQDDPHSDAYPEGENRAKRQKTSKHGTYIIGESSSQADESGPSHQDYM